jgi:hypothetical protein
VGQLDSTLSDDQGKTPKALHLFLAINPCTIDGHPTEAKHDWLTPDRASVRIASPIGPPCSQLRSQEESDAHGDK